MTAGGWQLRAGHFSDGDALHAIERRAHRHPWSRRQFDEVLDGDNRVFVLVDHAGRCGGYAVLTLTLDDSELLNIAVEPALRRQGLASLLLSGVLVHMKALGARRCFLEVRPSNTAALALYRRFGFAQVGLRRDYYPDTGGGREDARVLCLEFTEEAPA